MSEQDSMTERELAEYFQQEVFSDQPRSVGEALAVADEEQEVPAEEGTTVVAEPPIEVEDVPTQPEPEIDEEPAAPVEAPVEEEEPGEEVADENVAWATKKYGEDTGKWAQALRHQEQHISRLAAEKKEAEEGWAEAYQYAQQVEQQASQQTQMTMPLSSSEEDWIESSMANPYQAARQAALQGNFNLFNGVIARAAEDNAMVAAQIHSQVTREIEQLAAQEQNGQMYQQPSLAEEMASSIQRLGIDLNTYGEPMSAKVAELGEFHPYVQTILEGEQSARDIALMAVYDLVRTSAMSTRRVRSQERDDQIKHEAELRRQAAGVVTGGPHQEQPPKQSPFMDAMEQEWRARGQWTDE